MQKAKKHGKREDDFPELSRSEYEHIIDEWVFNEKARNIIKRRMLDGVTYDRLAVEFDMLGVNPFDQPGVEAYKKNMFALLEKPGHEEASKAIRAKLNN